MRIFGVDIKGKEARLALMGQSDNGLELIACATTKVALGDDKISSSLTTFLTSISTLASENKVDSFAIKARAPKGKMAAGGISFKIEALFQLVSGIECEFINPVALSSFFKKCQQELPTGLNAYQHDAYRCAVYALTRSIQK